MNSGRLKWVKIPPKRVGYKHTGDADKKRVNKKSDGIIKFT